MSIPDTAARAEQLHRLHQGERPLVLVNAWDAGSARVLEAAGCPVIATSSAAMAWSLGCVDGERLPAAELIEAVARIARVVRVPLTVDLERGYGSSADEVGRRVQSLIDLGVVGINIEDGRDAGALAPVGVMCGRIEAARRVAQRCGVPLFINARTDACLLPSVRPGDRFDAAQQRARQFIEAGADGIFVPGMDRLDDIARFVQAVGRPFNVYAGYPGVPDVDALAGAGVRRVSLGCGPLQSAYGLLGRIAGEALQRGRTHTMCDGMMSAAQLNALLSPRPSAAP